jgi:hypothetical protein
MNTRSARPLIPGSVVRPAYRHHQVEPSEVAAIFVREHDPLMRLGAARQYVALTLMIVFGLSGLYVGYFRSGTFEPVAALVGAVFLVSGVHFLVRALRRRNIRGPVWGQGPVGGALQARVASDVRTYYTKPSTRLCNPASPSEFDRQMLALLDSIESGVGDIDARIEALRSYIQSEGTFQRWKDQYKANAVWRKGDGSLLWVPETWELRTNWARLRLLAPMWGSYTMTKAWAVPTGGQPGVGAP